MGYSEKELKRIQETGSRNISKASPEWKAILEKAREEHEDCGNECQYDIHHAYRLVNKEVAAGIPWAKCSNCGSPYRLNYQGNTSTHCSEECFQVETDALNDW